MTLVRKSKRKLYQIMILVRKSRRTLCQIMTLVRESKRQSCCRPAQGWISSSPYLGYPRYLRCLRYLRYLKYFGYLKQSKGNHYQTMTLGYFCIQFWSPGAIWRILGHPVGDQGMPCPQSRDYCVESRVCYLETIVY